MDFKPGQKVVYPNYGVTVVEKIDAASWDGLQQRCYHLRLLSNNAQIMVPLANTELVGLRPLGGNGEIRSVIIVQVCGDDGLKPGPDAIIDRRQERWDVALLERLQLQPASQALAPCCKPT